MLWIIIRQTSYNIILFILKENFKKKKKVNDNVILTTF